jgi:hypothetical protein
MRSLSEIGFDVAGSARDMISLPEMTREARKFVQKSTVAKCETWLPQATAKADCRVRIGRD